MAKFTIDWLQVKKPDWYQVSLRDEQGSPILNVYMSQLDKITGKQAWPDWANIRAGQTLEGKLWTSPKGQQYLFPDHKDENADGVVVQVGNGGNYASRGNYGAKGAGIAAAQDRKEKSIDNFQAAKEFSIRESSTFRDATLLTVAELGEGADHETIKQTWHKWRDYLNSQYNLPY